MKLLLVISLLAAVPTATASPSRSDKQPPFRRLNVFYNEGDHGRTHFYNVSEIARAQTHDIFDLPPSCHAENIGTNPYNGRTRFKITCRDDDYDDYYVDIYDLPPSCHAENLGTNPYDGRTRFKIACEDDDDDYYVDIYDLPPSCHAENLGTNPDDGRTRFKITCENDDQYNEDDYLVGDDGQGDDYFADDDYAPSPTPGMVPRPTPVFIEDDDVVAAEEEDDDTDDDGAVDGLLEDDFLNDDGEDNATVIAGAETDVVEQQDDTGTTKINSTSAVLMALGISALVLLFCCFCFRRNRNRKDPDNDDDMEKLLGNDIEQAYSTPNAYLDDEYDPPFPVAFDDLEDEGQWDAYFQSLQEYKEDHGDCLVPPFYRDKDGRPLGRWVSLQRHLAAANELSQDKIDKLNSLGFEWQLQPGDGKAEDFGIVTDPKLYKEYVKSLEAYKKKHGDCNVPIDYEDSKGRPLGKWVHHQRHRARRGTLTPSQKAKLDALGFLWTLPANGARNYDDTIEDDDLWHEYLQSLKDYRDMYGDCLVPNGYRDKERRPLGQWVSLQRHLAAANELSQDKIDKLNALGFVWELQEGDGTAEEYGIVTDPELWQAYLDSLKAYKEEHGDCNVPLSYIDSEGRYLGKWAQHQRYRNKRGTLPKEQKEQLDALGFDWTLPDVVQVSRNIGSNGIPPKRRSSLLKRLFSFGKRDGDVPGEEFGPDGDKDWDNYVAALIEYKTEFGDCNVPRPFVNEKGRRLGEWVSYQRVRNAGNKLPADKFSQLDALGFIWELQPEDDEYRRGPTLADVVKDWDNYVIALAKYKVSHGDCMVPRSYKDKWGRPLGTWVANVRDVAAQNELPQNKRDELDTLGFHWESHRGDGYGLPRGCGYGRWEQHFDSLASYITEHGDYNVASDYVDKDGLELGAWLSNIRHRASQDELPYTNMDRLRALGVDVQSVDQETSGNKLFSFHWEKQQVGDSGFNQEVWYKHLNSLADYKSKYHNTLVPRTYEDPNGIGLGAWCINQSENASQNKLSSKRLKELNQLGFDPEWFNHGLSARTKHPRVYDGVDDFADEEVSMNSGRPAHVNVHRCSSAVCEICGHGASKGVTFIPLKR